MRISARRHREAREPMPEPHEKTKYIISESCYITIPVIMAVRTHLFPFRTQKLSSLAPKVLVGTPTGRIGRCRISINKRGTLYLFYLYIAIILPVEGGRARNSQNSTVCCFAVRDEQTHTFRVCGARGGGRSLPPPRRSLPKTIA